MYFCSYIALGLLATFGMFIFHSKQCCRTYEARRKWIKWRISSWHSERQRIENRISSVNTLWPEARWWKSCRRWRQQEFVSLLNENIRIIIKFSLDSIVYVSFSTISWHWLRCWLCDGVRPFKNPFRRRIHRIHSLLNLYIKSTRYTNNHIKYCYIIVSLYIGFDY